MISKCYTSVNFIPDNSNWVTSLENAELKKILLKQEIRITSKKIALCQVNYFPDKYTAIQNSAIYRALGNKLAFDYYHGDPSITPEFSSIFERLKKHKDHFHRIRVSHSGIENLLMNEGFSDKVFRIPIGINTNFFSLQTNQKKFLTREKLGIPQSSFVIGSFQKDGNGWGEGLSPKLIKGPDVLLDVLRILKNYIPEIFVLLTGPSRGYVINGLERLKIPYKHYYVDEYQNICQYYHTLDAYLVTSREEGGPKSILESMASGVPIVSTAVGQAQDLIVNHENGWVSDSGDVSELSENIINIYNGIELIQSIKKSAVLTAERNSYQSQGVLWKEFFSPILSSHII